MSPSPVFSDLSPAEVWQHFATLCAIPRASKQEAALRAHLQDWAAQAGISAEVDAAGNLLLLSPASPGCEQVPGVILQAHLDMVCQKNSTSPHDFSRDPIQPVLRDGWLVADETTLGADNGIGVALILAALSDRTLRRGPLEALLTVDEEAGMGGARGLSPDRLKGRLMLNLDTEAWGEFYLGCAGGMDVDIRRDGEPEPLPAGWTVCEIALRGLRGGHSGVDIHEERGNAIKLMVGVLHDLAAHVPYRLVSLRGGTARNALAREAFATLAFPEALDLSDWLAGQQAGLREHLRGIEAQLSLSITPASARDMLGAEEQFVWLASLHAAPHGVRRMSRQVPGVVETSNNLGMVDLQPAGGSCNFMVRSLVDRGAEALADEIVSLFALGVRNHRCALSGAGYRFLRADHSWRTCAGRAGGGCLGWRLLALAAQCIERARSRLIFPESQRSTAGLPGFSAQRPRMASQRASPSLLERSSFWAKAGKSRPRRARSSLA
ncbi:MAG: beta-Ala-His dipeptidase [Azonexus sp.]|nr:beta-Ala-His dipeptidase [Azonexus sp.]